jgi:hypothetical protein
MASTITKKLPDYPEEIPIAINLDEQVITKKIDLSEHEVQVIVKNFPHIISKLMPTLSMPHEIGIKLPVNFVGFEDSDGLLIYDSNDEQILVQVW